MHAKQKVGLLQAFGLAGKFGFDRFLHRAIRRLVAFLLVAPTQPAQNAKAIRFEGQSAGNAAKEQDLFGAGVANGGKLLESLFGFGVGLLRIESRSPLY